jgi:hypothetical protein
VVAAYLANPPYPAAPARPGRGDGASVQFGRRDGASVQFGRHDGASVQFGRHDGAARRQARLTQAGAGHPGRQNH